MAQESKQLKMTTGVLGTPLEKKGKILPDSTAIAVKEFYENDINSRIMANKKDVVKVIIDGQK